MFSEFRRSKCRDIPDVVIIWVWKISIVSTSDLFFTKLRYLDVRCIKDLERILDHSIFPKTHISRLAEYIRILRSCSLHHILRSIDSKKVIPSKVPPLSTPEEIRRHIHDICVEAARQLFRKQCALLIRNRMFTWYRASFKSQELLVKNKSCEPQIMTVYYHPSEPFWPHALSSQFGGLENGRYVVRCAREGTTPEAVEWVCRFTINRRKTLREIQSRFYEMTSDYDSFEAWIRSMCIIADKWFYPAITDLITGLFMEYTNDTIGAQWIKCGLRKMELFVSKDPIIARYIWETNCASEKMRVVLATQAGIGKKLFSGFIKSTTIDDLSQYIHRRASMQKTVYDDLSADLKKKIRAAEADLLEAHRGVRVGLLGRYISSDSIHAASSRLYELWRRADREVLQKKRCS